MDRRRFLQVGAVAGLSAAFATRPREVRAQHAGPVAEFPSGVLSGDPTAKSVVLWTRIDPWVAGTGIDVDWEVATTPEFGPGSTVAMGTETTSVASNHTVKVDVEGLTAGTTWWYRFRAAGVHSPVGRTKTLPRGSTDGLRIAFFSCQRWVHGYYTAHADLASLANSPDTDIDLVVCLGDYVYEPGPADDVEVPGRIEPDGPAVTLDDFRAQYHWYRHDPDLQAMHANYPVVGVFDNHDGMSGPADAAGPGAVAAFFEQMPVREDPSDPTRQHRSFRLGDLAELILLDERQHRDPTPPSGENLLGTSSVEEPSMVDAGRSMLGSAQKRWLTETLDVSDAQWKIIGSQLMFAPLRSELFADVQATAGDGPQRNAGRYVNTTQWDGYQAERRELVDHIHDAGIDDVVVIAGDTHFWTTSEVPLDHDDPDAPLVLTEFGGSSISSANAGEQTDLPGNDVIRPVVAAANPLSLRFMEVTTHGYGIVELSASRATVTYRSPASTARPSASSAVLARFEVDAGAAAIRQVEGEGFMPRPDRPAAPSPSPAGPVVDAPAASPATAVPGSPSYTG